MSVSVCVRERECVCERELVCVCERELVCVCVCDVSVCVVEPGQGTVSRNRVE